MSTAEKRRYTPEEYLAFERASETKHEYFGGEIFAMVGASWAHNQIVANLLRILGNQLLESPCQPMPSDQRMKVIATGLYTYPDVTVVCSEPEFEPDIFDTLLNPKLIVEVLSESTEAYDRGQKFAQYRTIDSFQEYVLISQREYGIEVFTRQDKAPWLFSDARGLDANLELPSIDCTLPLKDVYYRVAITEPDGEGEN